MDRTKAAEILHKARVCYATEYLDCHMVCDMCKYHVEDSLVVEAIDTAIKALDKDIDAPSKWIPVSERLPDDNTIVLVTFENGKVGRSSWHITNTYNNGFDAVMHGITKDDELLTFGVVAWMPLPAPWKGEGE